MTIRLRLVSYADKMPAGFSGRGYDSTCGRYYVSIRNDANGCGHASGHLLNWAILDWKTNTYRDQFCYRRDAVKFAEAGGFDAV